MIIPQLDNCYAAVETDQFALLCYLPGLNSCPSFWCKMTPLYPSW